MICDTCKIAAEMNRRGKTKDAQDFHKGCGGCECQHRVGIGWFVREGEKPSQYHTQSP